jgi:cysteine synthase A
MPESAREERRALLAALGAEVVLTLAEEGMDGATATTAAIAEKREGVLAGQFENAANPEAHRHTTGPEIWEAAAGEVDVFVAGVGTGGTITGVTEYLRGVAETDIDSVAVEPANSPVLSGGEAGSHSVQGIGAGFVPAVLRTDLLDEVRAVGHDRAVETTRRLAREEGILAGVSAGAALAAATDVARERPEELVVVVLPDTGERYLSTDLFESP